MYPAFSFDGRTCNGGGLASLTRTVFACWPLLHGACDPENSDLAAWRRKTLLGVVRMHLAYWTGAQPASAPVSCTPGRLPAAFIGPGNLHSRAACGTPCCSRRSASLLRRLGTLGSGPTDAAMASPSQVQCCTLADHGPGAHSRAFASRLHRPLGAAAGEPSQVQCCTLAGHGAGKDAVDGKRKMTQLKLSHFSFGIRQCPTLPGRHQPSTIGAERLNFCVRYGNRWIPFAITTGMP